MTENQAQSTAVSGQNEDGKLHNRSAITAFDTEPAETSTESEVIDSERRSFELTRRQVQMMAFGINPLHTYTDLAASFGTGILYGPGSLLYSSGPISSALG